MTKPIGEISKDGLKIIIYLEYRLGSHHPVELTERLSERIIEELKDNVNKIDGDEIRIKTVKEPLLELLR